MTNSYIDRETLLARMVRALRTSIKIEDCYTRQFTYARAGLGRPSDRDDLAAVDLARAEHRARTPSIQGAAA